MTDFAWLDEIQKQNLPQDALQWADDQILMNAIKNIYQPNQAKLIETVKVMREALKWYSHSTTYSGAWDTPLIKGDMGKIAREALEKCK